MNEILLDIFSYEFQLRPDPSRYFVLQLEIPLERVAQFS